VARERERPTQEAPLSPLLTATQTQWPGLRGAWNIEQRDTQISTKPYRFVLLRLGLGNGGIATGVVAFASRHHHTETEMIGGVAGWAGYAIAAEVARLGGFPLVGNVPEHFRVDRRPVTGRAQRRIAPAQVPSIGLADILRVGDIVDLGDGRTPTERAAATLEFFLGQETYTLLEHQGFLDVPSVRYASEQRVYRLRRDPHKQRERRVRVYQNGVYSKDFCIIRNQDVPADDWWLTVWLGLLSDEDATLSVVQQHNVFAPFSDGHERETIPAIWTPRPAAASVA